VRKYSELKIKKIVLWKLRKGSIVTMIASIYARLVINLDESVEPWFIAQALAFRVRLKNTQFTKKVMRQSIPCTVRFAHN